MTHEKAISIFKPFNQQNTEVRGNGVGLSICKKICEQLGGSIEVDSEVGKGSTFTYSMEALQVNEMIKNEHKTSSKKTNEETQPKPKPKKEKRILTDIKEESDQENGSS